MGAKTQGQPLSTVLERCLFYSVDDFFDETFFAFESFVVERSAVENVKGLGLLDPPNDLYVRDTDDTTTTALLCTDVRACGQQHKG